MGLVVIYNRMRNTRKNSDGQGETWMTRKRVYENALGEKESTLFYEIVQSLHNRHPVSQFLKKKTSHSHLYLLITLRLLHLIYAFRHRLVLVHGNNNN